jgi:hypothetical protein
MKCKTKKIKREIRTTSKQIKKPKKIKREIFHRLIQLQPTSIIQTARR